MLEREYGHEQPGDDQQDRVGDAEPIGHGGNRRHPDEQAQSVRDVHHDRSAWSSTGASGDIATRVNLSGAVPPS